MKKKGKYKNISGGRDSWMDADLKVTNEDAVLFGVIGDYMKAIIDTEDVKSDPDYAAAGDMARAMVSDYRNKKERNRENEEFIRESFAATDKDGILKEISDIKEEINRNSLDKVTADWVKEWHKKTQGTGATDPKIKEIRDFIENSPGAGKREPEIFSSTRSEKTSVRRLLPRYILLPAAALIGAIVLIRTLLPSYNPDRLFNSYYKPFEAVSPVTRGTNNSETTTYGAAVESYKLGDYQGAAAGFSKALQNNPSSVAVRFYLGMTQIGLGEYNQAVSLLSGIAEGQGENVKDARWYLGLLYMKTGDKAKAAACFELLAQSPGFYQDRSEKILRRLKQ